MTYDISCCGKFLQNQALTLVTFSFPSPICPINPHPTCSMFMHAISPRFCSQFCPLFFFISTGGRGSLYRWLFRGIGLSTVRIFFKIKQQYIEYREHTPGLTDSGSALSSPYRWRKSRSGTHVSTSVADNVEGPTSYRQPSTKNERNHS